MNRVQRFEALAIERNGLRQCERTIVLAGTTYRCLRGGRDRIHEGAHDAGCAAPDGYLVRW